VADRDQIAAELKNEFAFDECLLDDVPIGDNKAETIARNERWTPEIESHWRDDYRYRWHKVICKTIDALETMRRGAS
jgi:hypothetical protein